MKWVIMILAGLMVGCAAKEKPALQKQAASERPLAAYVQIAISLREVSGGVRAVRPFYEKLGFVAVEEGGEPVPFVVMSDGVIHLRLDECEFPSPRLDYYTSDAPKQVQRLEGLGIMYSTEVACARKVNVTNFSDPNGQQLALIQRDHAPVAEPRKPNSLLGNFGEFSIHTANRDESVEWYRKLGFEAKKFDKPWPWAILSDGRMTIGLHQSDEFSKTTITYFSKDSAERIEKLKGMGFKFSNEQKKSAGKVANAALAGPDGQMFFVFEE
jgi:hypothetical protein